MTENPSRRRVLIWMGNLGLLGVVWAAVKGSVRFLNPPVTQPETPPVDTGTPEEFPLGSLTFIPAAKAWLARDDGGFFALSAVCPHLGCTLGTDGAAFACPCHGSRFNAAGTVAHGPAITNMRYLRVEVADGRVMVHPGETVSADIRVAG